MKKVLVSFIQDRSGSMSSVWTETLNGFKTYVENLQEDQKKDNEVEYLFSLTTFDTVIETPHVGSKIADVDGTVLKHHGPRNATALYDAVGKTLQAIDDNKSLTFDKAIVVIVTDGQENSSREWSKDALHSAIDERVKRGNWTFTYLGTQPETWDEAQSLGVGVGASATYTAANAGATYATMAHATAMGARSAPAQFRSFLHQNTTKSARRAVGMRTRTDVDDDPTVGIGVSGGLSGGGIPSTGGISQAKPFSRTPRQPVKKPSSTTKKWK